jgi:hypothetical protein
LPPGVIVIGKVFGVNVNCPSDDVIPDIIRSAVPVLLTVACNVAFEPTGTEPKSRLDGVISNDCPNTDPENNNTKQNNENSFCISHTFVIFTNVCPLHVA